VADTTTTLLAVKVTNVPDAIPAQLDPATHLDESVQGKRIEFSDGSLRAVADIARVRKIYKLNSSNKSAGGGSKRGKGGNTGGSASDASQTNGVQNEVDELKEMEAVILGIMALKGS
jgi:EKC/KEOPS complex subunit CGI121/TPRKB